MCVFGWSSCGSCKTSGGGGSTPLLSDLCLRRLLELQPQPHGMHLACPCAAVRAVLSGSERF